MSGWLGISRGPDTRPPEVKAAFERIGYGYPAFDTVASHQICLECQQTARVIFDEIKHLETCKTGRIITQWVEGTGMNKTSLLYWWPKVKGLGIPVPVTEAVMADHMLILGAMEAANSLPEQFMPTLSSTCDRIGYPLFLRTDLQSGKHGWKDTCFVPSASVLQQHMFRIAEENEMGACMFGPGYEAFVVREFLPLETAFIAFYGQMPINKERRYFVSGPKILCHHPYWPEEAFLDHTNDGDWKEKLEQLNYESDEEIELLSEYAKTVGAALPEDSWSVDFAKSKDGKWYLIDMAIAGESFHWKPCEARHSGRY